MFIEFIAYLDYNLYDQSGESTKTLVQRIKLF